MTEDDKFFERLRAGARPLRQQPDAATLNRIRARIHAHIAAELDFERPTIAQLLTAWFRPLATAAITVALAATIGIFAVNRTDSSSSLGTNALEVSAGGETYVVAP
jgi:hypothetical protein